MSKGYMFDTPKGKYLVRCPKCGRENYIPAVASGKCYWCRYNANKEVV